MLLIINLISLLGVGYVLAQAPGDFLSEEVWTGPSKVD